MTVPASRSEFKEYCLRKLGKPVVDINISENQVDDRVDEALRYYWDYHFDGSDVEYYKHRVTANNRHGAIYSLTVANGGIGYSNSDTLVYTNPSGSGANATITTNANGTITAVTLLDNGSSFYTAPTITITTSAGTGGSITAETGGWIPMPENIIGAVRVFPLYSGASSKNMFDIRYQIALNDLYTLTNQSLVPYYMNMQAIQLYQEILVGEIPIRYSRHRDRLYVDMNWDRIVNDEYLVIEAYKIVDPEVYTDVWSDRWLQNYTTCLMKLQWGQNLIKYQGIQVMGGITFNGERILNDAIREKREMEEEMINGYSVPTTMLIG